MQIYQKAANSIKAKNKDTGYIKFSYIAEYNYH